METVFDKKIKPVMIILFILLLILSISNNSYAASSKIKSVTLDKTSAEVNVGFSFTLKATVKKNSLFASKKVNWSSSNTSVATVDSKGKVTGKNAGTAKITATSTVDSSKKATCTVKVTYKEAPKQYNASVYEGYTVRLGNDIILPRVNSWKSTNEKIAKVVLSGEQCTVQGIKKGKVKINGYSTVQNIPVVTYILEVKETRKITKISLNKSSITLYEGQTSKLNVSYQPTNPTFNDFQWSTDNNKIATVDTNGNIKALKEGETYIRVYKDGKKASCKITVKEKWYWPIGKGSNGKPLATSISSGYGNRSISGSTGNFHGGIDIKCDKGTPVIATRKGKVIDVKSGFGDGKLDKSYMNKANYVIIKHSDGTTSRYWHLSTVSVKKNQTVSRGQVIGKSGNSGYTSGPHLHFEIQDKNGNTINPSSLNISSSNPY